ncbi:MAG: rhamnogalacturonan lyase family protein [Planctomycetota bacterium]|jgi:rhamnogalacturonan endolyase
MRRLLALSIGLLIGACLVAAELALAAEARPEIRNDTPGRVSEPLDRGLVARPLADGKVYLGWRLLESDPADVAFNVYRRTGDTEPVKLNEKPVRKTTDYIDGSAPKGTEHAWSVRAVVDGKEVITMVTGTVTIDGRPAENAVVTFQPAEGTKGTPLAGRVDSQGRYRIQMRSHQARATPSEEAPPYVSLQLDGDHTFQKVGVADLDGDGRYDFVIKRPNANIDPYVNYWKRSPDTYKLEAYRHDGKLLWRHDLGWAIERGIWYSPYVVYDLDGDGAAEVAVKTGEGDPRDPDGRVRSGPEHLTILDGQTGKPVTRIDWASREGFEGERGYNYASRNQLCVAFLDGKRPHLLVQRGTYNVMKLIAYRLEDGKLHEVWRWDNTQLPKTWWGQGAHWMHAADVDADGRDEVLLGSSVVDHDGMPLWTTGIGHPDHFYVGDIDPQRPGLEIYYGIERRQEERNGMCLVEAASGKILWGHEGFTRHVHGQGMCSDIDARHPGAECYSADTDSQKKFAWARLRTAKGEVISDENLGGFSPRCVYWDADPQRELLRSGRISDYGGSEMPPRVEGHVAAVADVLGDWREEIITSVPGELRIYTTTVPAQDRRVCLMQDPIYRMDVVVAAMGYFQIPMTSYDLATGTK